MMQPSMLVNDLMAGIFQTIQMTHTHAHTHTHTHTHTHRQVRELQTLQSDLCMCVNLSVCVSSGHKFVGK